MNRFSGFIILLLFFFLTGTLSAQVQTSERGEVLSFEATYTGDIVNNFHGGLKNGSAYLGMANMQVSFDAEKAGVLKRTKFFLQATNTHGALPSKELFGDLQGASNIEAGNHTFLQEFWIEISLSDFRITAGLQDLNVEFASSESASLFLNSSFGILPVISANIQAPIFPLTSLGITSCWKINDKTSWLTAVYDGSPTDFDFNPYNTNWQFNSGDGILIITELQRSLRFYELDGLYKLGFYTHNHFIEARTNIEFPDSLYHTTYGIYAYADQKIWQKESKFIGIFTQLGFSPSDACFNKMYVGFGVNACGLFEQKNPGTLGLAVAHLDIFGNTESETTFELTYQKQITENVFIQPDIQYMINPSGTSTSLSNCLAGMVRFELSF
jgi:porin